MHWKIKVIAILFVVTGCKSEKETKAFKQDYTSLIEAEELYTLIDQDGIKLIDVRDSVAFASGHIEGAIQIGRKDMEHSDDSIPGMRASAKHMADLLARKGISGDDRLILYDDRGNPEAARLWCILKSYGSKHVHLLNGGLTSWKAKGFDLDTTSTVEERATFSWKKEAGIPLWIHAEDLLQMVNNPSSGVKIIDTRTAEEYSGSRQKTNANRAGHIPGAIHMDWADLIAYHGDHGIKQKQQIQNLLTKFAIRADDSIVVYCHSGVRSSLSTFVLREVLQYPNVWNYDGSWTEWSRLPNYPIQTDSITKKLN